MLSMTGLMLLQSKAKEDVDPRSVEEIRVELEKEMAAAHDEEKR